VRAPAAIELRGRPFEIGLAHGEALRTRIRNFLDDDLCRLNRILSQPTSLHDLRDTIGRHSEIIAQDTPTLFEEVRGLALGGDIEMEQALLLQLRREVVGYSRFAMAGDCTSFCRMDGAAGPILAQTIDLNGDLDDQMTVANIINAATGRRSLVVTFTGLLGYLGLNDRGLAIGINLVLGGTWRPGVPPYLAIRHLLDHCDDVASSLRALARLRVASSRALLVCDGETAVMVELFEGKIAVIRDRPLIHTNHYLDPDFATMDAINPFSRNSSLKRLAACRDRLDEMPVLGDPEDIMQIFCRAPIRVQDNGDCRRERTVGAVVMMPRDGVLHLRCGDPAQATTQSFKLN
jgi:isopenicillin-N N-acyltransferase like protein